VHNNTIERTATSAVECKFYKSNHPQAHGFSIFRFDLSGLKGELGLNGRAIFVNRSQRIVRHAVDM